MARQVVRCLAAPPVQRDDDLDEEIQAKPVAYGISSFSPDPPAPVKRAFVAPKLQREEEDEEDDLVKASPLHGLDGGDVETSVAQTIQRARGSGSALDPRTRYGMESAFGADFGGVRVHTDAQADTLNRSLNARAFTMGNDIFFRQGEYRPGSSEGKQLLAHELTHTVQQRRGADGLVQRDNWLERRKRIVARFLFKSLPAHTYRFDTRTPAQLRETGGLQPWNAAGNITIREHVDNAYQNGLRQGQQTKYDSQFVSTGGYGMLKRIDPTFVQQILNTNIYKIDTALASQTGNFNDVNDYYDRLGVDRPYSTQREWLKEGGISYEAIVGWMPGITYADQIDPQTGDAPDEGALQGWQAMPP